MWSSSSLVSTLNRARRSDAHTANEAAITHTACLCQNENWGHIFTTKNAGATPNETMSQRLSNSAPNSLADFANRAMYPSRASKTIARKMSHALYMQLLGSLATV